jgi:hypothetical protein
VSGFALVQTAHYSILPGGDAAAGVRGSHVFWSEGILPSETRCGRDACAPRFVDDPTGEQLHGL